MFIVREEIVMIKHEGKYYTPEDLAKKLNVSGEIEVIVNDDSWFNQALEKEEEK